MNNCCICLKKKVSSSVRICAPSTSASVISIILPYLHFSKSKSSVPMPVPRALIIVLISSCASIFSSRAFSTLRIFPFNGRIAWMFLSRPLLAEPPAESPSTMKISVDAFCLLAQSHNLPGRLPLPNAPLRLVNSRALLAASLAAAACIALFKMRLASVGCSSRKWPNCSLTVVSTKLPTSGLVSRTFVCASKCGSASFTDTTAVSPSLKSSPVVVWPFFSKLLFLA